jgi:hypothetical protein
MSAFTAVNEAFRLARKQNDTLREALNKGSAASARETPPLTSKGQSQAASTKKPLESKAVPDPIAIQMDLFERVV